jgi:hypothetical protein
MRDEGNRIIRTISGMLTAPVDDNLAGFAQLGVFTCGVKRLQALPAKTIHDGHQPSQ